MLKRLWLDATESFAPLNKEEGKLSVGQMKWIPANDKLHVKAETGRGNEETLTAGRDPPLGNERHRPWLLSSQGTSKGEDGGVWCRAEVQPQSRVSRCATWSEPVWQPNLSKPGTLKSPVVLKAPLVSPKRTFVGN